MSEHFAHERRKFSHEGRTIYEWEQSMDEVNVFISLPANARASDLDVRLENTRASVGLRGNPPYLSGELARRAKSSENLWTVEDGGGVLHLTLSKANPGESWPSVFRDHGQLNAFEERRERESILLERFQREHPGMDFSGATVSGDVPDPSSFLH